MSKPPDRFFQSRIFPKDDICPEENYFPEGLYPCRVYAKTLKTKVSLGKLENNNTYVHRYRRIALTLNALKKISAHCLCYINNTYKTLIILKQ